MSPDLAVLGNLLVDDLVFEDGRTRMGEPGGAALHAALGASLWGLPTGIVSWRGEDYPSSALESLSARGVDLAGVHDLGRPGVRVWLLYEGRRRQLVHRLERPSHAEVSPSIAQVPASWRGARAFHLAPMPFEIQRDLAGSLPPTALVSIDPHLPLASDTITAWLRVLSGVDVVFLGEDEMSLPGADDDPRAVVRGLRGERLRFVVLKRGARGGILYDAHEDRFLDWTARAEAVVDPTGAGDAFAGGFLAGRLHGDDPAAALRRGIVAASFALEDWGAAGLLAATREKAEERRNAWAHP